MLLNLAQTIAYFFTLRGLLPPQDYEGYIRVRLAQRPGQWLICVQNAAAAPAGGDATTKGDPLLHGYGLKNAREVLARHGAELVTHAEPGSFLASAVLFV